MTPTPAPEPDARPDPQPGPDRVARTASDTSDPLRALAAVSALRRLADQLEHLQVEAALRQGHAGALVVPQALGIQPVKAQRCGQQQNRQQGGQLPAGEARSAHERLRRLRCRR